MPIRMNGRLYSQGDVVVFNHQARAHTGAPSGLRVELYSLASNGKIGLYSLDHKVGGWNDLNGEVDDYRGWFIDASELEGIIERSDARYEINKSIVYRGKELKGMPCKVVASIEGHLVFVELDEHVDGCSADGLGKAGHCVAVSDRSIKVIKKPDKKKQAK